MTVISLMVSHAVLASKARELDERIVLCIVLKVASMYISMDI